MLKQSEIAAWLREAAKAETVHAENYKSIGATILHDGSTERATQLEQRAAQVEAMRCESCARYDMPYGWCNKFDLALNKDFGCFHHEPKDTPAG